MHPEATTASERRCCRQPSSFVLSRCSKEYPGISKNSVRQRLISSHGHLAGKLAGGVLTAHPQVLSSYQYEAGVPLATSDSQDPISNHFPPSRDAGLLYHCFKHRGTSSAALASDVEPAMMTAIFFADNSRHLDLGCKRPYLETSPAVSEEHYFRSAPSYEASLLSRSYRNEAFSAREACMYGGMETESGSGAGDLDDVNNSPSINCNMWATMQPYPRYTVDGVPYQPFTAHFTNTATVTPVTPHPGSAMAARPQSDLGVYNPASVQRGLPAIPPPSSSSSCSPATLASRDRSELSALYQSKPASPLRPFSAYPSQGSIRDPPLQYQVGLNSTGTHWTDS